LDSSSQESWFYPQFILELGALGGSHFRPAIAESSPMPSFSIRGILLDIEGTTSSVSYVYDVMFPFAQVGLDQYLKQHWTDQACAEACDQIARDAGHASLDAWAMQRDPLEIVRAEVLRLMDADIKATGLKQLQGLIWQAGFEGGELRAHVYEDVPPGLARWQSAGIDMRIYSSGSVHAQRLFFGHVDWGAGHADPGNGREGDLLPYFSGHYDTTTGPKREEASYARIAADWQLPAADILFASDIRAELDAARRAGLQTVLVCRPGNAKVDDPGTHPVITDFGEIQIIPRS